VQSSTLLEKLSLFFKHGRCPLAPMWPPWRHVITLYSSAKVSSSDILRLLVDSLVFALLNTILALEGSLYCIVALLAFCHRGFLVFEFVDFVASRGIGMMDQNCHGSRVKKETSKPIVTLDFPRN